MEEKPPTQAGRDVPRSRTPRAAFNTPDQPTPSSKPAERAPRRTKAAPAVTFQAPAGGEEANGEGAGTSPDAGREARAPRKPAQRRSQPAGDPSGTTPAKRTKAAKTAKAVRAASAEIDPPARALKATPAKRPPKKLPAQTSTTEGLGTGAAAGKPPRPKKASARKPRVAQQPGPAAAEQLDAAPAQPVADATPPARAMPTQPRPADTSPEAEQQQPTTFAKLAADPGHAPELLALAAVRTIGPRAQEWAKRTREAYPKATDAALARLAADQFTRFSSPASIIAAVAGSYSPAVLIGTTALTHARVILHVAAAYGIDATDEARAVDLLVLTRSHANREEAEAALAATKQATGEKAAKEKRNAVRRLGRSVATNAAGWAAVRLVNRYFPGSSLLAAALVSRSSARSAADRANTYYSQASHALGSRV